MNKTTRNVMYIIIIVVCIIAIFVGVYAQFFKKVSDNDINYNLMNTNTSNNSTSVEEIKDSFKDLFTNEYFGFDYNEEEIEKIDSQNPIVYSGINFSKQEEDKYDIKATLPIINIVGEIPANFNNITENTFVAKLNNIINEAKEYTICDMSYTAYVNNDILSVAIMVSLKEGENPQRIAIQTYNYNLKTSEEVKITDILEIRGLEESTVNKRIKAVVEKAAQDAKSMQNTGYNVYERNLQSDMYDVTQVQNFIQGPNGELYIIYSYGNNANTSEMDVIEV